MSNQPFIFVVEHLDPELGPWSALEYKTIAKESKEHGCRFILSSVPASLLQSEEMSELQKWGAEARNDSIETYFDSNKDKICLLDPAAEQELDPADFNVFDVFLFGGILGDDPPRAVRVTRTVILDKVHLDKIPYVDYPELKLNEHETTEMPFRYVADESGNPIMPEGMIDLIKADADKAFDSLEFADEAQGLDDLKVNDS
ncbi:hypothetical protein KCU88_g7115, partial [Aureobasidium melanogenum]